MSGFPSALGVVRVYVKHVGEPLVSLPDRMANAKNKAAQLVRMIARQGGSDVLIEFDRGDSLPCFIRARDVTVVDVVSTEDPGVA